MAKLDINVLIVDDESLARANLRNLLGTYCHSLKVCGEASGVMEAIEKVNRLNPDVIFLDISMPERNGFDLINHLTEPPSVVFVTAHEEYALRAMKVCAVDFLLKPISIPELMETQRKLLQIHSLKPEIRKNYGLVLRNLSAMLGRKEPIQKIALYLGNGYEIFDTDKIIYVSADNNYSLFHFTKQKPILISKTLKEYEDILGTFGFMRIHKSTLVNLYHIKKILQQQTLEVTLSNGIQLQVSRRKADDLMTWRREQLKASSK